MRYTQTGMAGAFILIGGAAMLVAGGSLAEVVYNFLPLPLALGAVLVLSGRELVSEDAIEIEKKAQKAAEAKASGKA